MKVLLWIFAIDTWFGCLLAAGVGIYCIINNSYAWVIMFPVAIMFFIIGTLAVYLSNNL